MSTNPRIWLRLSAEGVAIVLSILVAFAIDAWWARTQEAERLDQVLTSLEAGLSESRRSIAENIDSASADATRVGHFIAMDARGVARTPADSTFDLLEAIWRPHTNDNNLTFLRAALDDEGLERLDDPVLQAALVRWREDVDQLAEIGTALASAQNETLRALGTYPEVGLMLSGQTSSASPETMSAVRNDVEIYSLSARKAFLTTIQLADLRRLLADSEALHEAVRVIRAR